jgi:hypothetical protein
MVRGGVLTLAIVALAAAPAMAETPPIEGGTNVGGQVEGSLELILPQAGGFSSFKRAGTFTFSFNVLMTTTEKAGQLDIVDGDTASGSKLGHMASGSKRLPDPLEARIGKAAFQPLDEALDPFQASGPFTRKASKVTLRQKVRSKPSGTYRKVLLITGSTETP